MDLQDLIAEIALHIRDNRLSDSIDGMLTRAFAIRLIQNESDMLLKRGVQINVDAFRDSVDISLVADQRQYDLPEAVQQVRWVSRPDLDANRPPHLVPVTWEEAQSVYANDFIPTGLTNVGPAGGYHAYGQRPVRILLTNIPASSIANALRIQYSAWVEHDEQIPVVTPHALFKPVQRRLVPFGIVQHRSPYAIVPQGMYLVRPPGIETFMKWVVVNVFAPIASIAFPVPIVVTNSIISSDTSA